MKSGSLTTTSNENGRGRIAVNRRKRWPSLDWGPERFWYLFGGIGRELSTTSCFPTAKLLILTCTVNNWTVWRKQSPRSGQLWPIEEELCSIRTTPGRTHLWWLARSSGSLVGRFLCIHLIVRTWHQVIITCSRPWHTILLVKDSSQEKLVKIDYLSFLPVRIMDSMREA